jgi:hypothetical protein
VATVRRRTIALMALVLPLAGKAAPAATWQPSPGHVQAPIWPDVMPDALADPEPEAIGPPPGNR